MDKEEVGDDLHLHGIPLSPDEILKIASQKIGAIAVPRVDAQSSAKRSALLLALERLQSQRGASK